LSYKKGQTPQYGKIRDPDYDEGDFVFVFDKRNEPPSIMQTIDFSNLENEAKWAEWQQNFQEKVDRLRKYDKNDGIAADSKKNAWERLLKAYNQDNPYSDKDEQLRAYAKERIIYWKNYRNKDLMSSRELRTDEEKPADVKAVESKAKNVYKNDKDFWEADYGDGIIMVYIPEGEFTMGSNDGNDDERPLHKVYLDGYWMGKTEVTVGQYKTFISETGHRFLPGSVYKYSPGDNHPVIAVSWDDANSYCKWLSKKTGLRLKLPTEAQWEKAARGTDRRKYPWGNHEPFYREKWYANYAAHNSWEKRGEDGFEFTAPVDSYSQGASPYGVLNMAGNVWEWCNDWYGSDYYKNSTDKNPIGPAGGTYRVLRGGGCYNSADGIRCAFRFSGDPSYRGYVVGFRLCQDKG
jgi:formylglycine-generating enzyme required for sulfatase activity